MRRPPLGLYALSAGSGDGGYPLALISPSSERTISSTLGELPRPDVKLLMHPTMHRRGGLQRATSSASSTSSARCTARCGVPDRPARHRQPAERLWRRSTATASTATALAPDTLTDIGGGACFNDARVQVAALPIA